MSDTWTIGELAERAAHALRAGAQPVNGRVRDVPGERLIRWYTTIGLVDPPLTRRGRIARYGRRHLLQLVAVKRMQAAGHSIAQIQTALTGATDGMLESAAALDDVATPPTEPAATRTPQRARPGGTSEQSSRELAAGAASEGSTADRGARRERFWAERPSSAATRREGDEGRGGGVVKGVVLGEGVRIVWDGGRVPSEEDVQAVLAAAGPLLAVLKERRLL